jgi:hypothetical protein
MALAIAAAAAGFFVGQGSSYEADSVRRQALQGQALTLAGQVEAAVSALTRIEAGDTASAKQTLEAQIKSGLAFLEVSREGLDGADAVLVDQAIRVGLSYAEQHKLQVPSFKQGTD